MPGPQSFSFFRRKQLRFNDIDVEIEGYRVVDSEYVIPLIEKRNEALEIGVKYQKLIKKIEGKNESEITEEDAALIKELKNRVDTLIIEISRISYPLAQRGVKRALYRDTEEYREAESENRLTEYLDSLPDVEMPPSMVTEVVNTMLELGNPDLIGMVEEPGPKKKKGTRRRSGSSSKGKSTT